MQAAFVHWTESLQTDLEACHLLLCVCLCLLLQVGTPERPLSDLGRVSYISYWTRVLMPVLKEREGTVSIKELSELTCIKPDDIIMTLQQLGLIQYQKGQHVLVAPPKVLDQCLREAGSWGLQVGGGRGGGGYIGAMGGGCWGEVEGGTGVYWLHGCCGIRAWC